MCCNNSSLCNINPQLATEDVDHRACGVVEGQRRRCSFTLQWGHSCASEPPPPPSISLTSSTRSRSEGRKRKEDRLINALLSFT